MIIDFSSTVKGAKEGWRLGVGLGLTLKVSVVMSTIFHCCREALELWTLDLPVAVSR
jgi:hypothetical protein